MSNYMKKLCAKSGVAEIRFHGLRHSHVSYLLHKGVDIQYISKRVGHKNVNVTLSTYAHMLKEKELAQDELALKILSKK
ncbi:tyrosine-type recombinase/integrase [Weissella soli]|uniref:tyrosine-type recombinase/integrase n=1 Tax=Weissella soli TaxID=155866 RepID=UPI003EF5B972